MRNMLMKIASKLLLVTAFCSAIICVPVKPSDAQTDLHVSGAQAGFPVAVPLLCDAGGGDEAGRTISDAIARNLDISGIFNVLNPSMFVETPGKCGGVDSIAFSDWSVIGAEGLVKGDIRTTGLSSGTIEVQLLLYDVLQKRAVIGKRYEADTADAKKIADRFSNEIVKYFTGELGIFGTKITYVSRVGRFKELFVMDVDGQNIRQLTRDKGLIVSPSWSPAGDRIVYTSYVTRKPQLFINTPAGGKGKQITEVDGLVIGAKFTRDGQNLVASTTVNGVPNIVKFDLRGRLVDKLTASGAIDVSPSFSPDGSQIAFCSNRAGGPQIYVMPASGEGSGRARRISFTNSDYCTSPTWSPKGDKIAFVCRDRGNQLFISSPDGSNVSQLSYRGFNEDPNWSPDGRFIAFSSDLGRGGPRNIAIMPLLTGRARQLTFSKSEDSQPSWSPRLE